MAQHPHQRLKIIIQHEHALLCTRECAHLHVQLSLYTLCTTICVQLSLYTLDVHCIHCKEQRPIYTVYTVYCIHWIYLALCSVYSVHLCISRAKTYIHCCLYSIYPVYTVHSVYSVYRSVYTLLEQDLYTLVYSVYTAKSKDLRRMARSSSSSYADMRTSMYMHVCVFTCANIYIYMQRANIYIYMQSSKT